MTPEPQNGFGVSSLIIFGEPKRAFLLGSCDFWGAERGFLMVNCGVFVVKTWLQTAAN
jgi:hypothetical protein